MRLLILRQSPFLFQPERCVECHFLCVPFKREISICTFFGWNKKMHSREERIRATQKI